MSKRRLILSKAALLLEVASAANFAVPVPILNNSRYIGGTRSEQAFGVCVDSVGNTYITGETSSSDYATNSLASASGGTDVFFMKLSPEGEVVYSKRFGGSRNDTGRRIGLDQHGNIYIAGYTASTNFPVANPLQPGFGGGQSDGFLAKLDPSGSVLLYSTYFGGNRAEAVGGLAIDSKGSPYLTGWTDSTNLPMAKPFQPRLNGGKDVFAAKVSADGSHLIYSTYLGGSADDNAFFLTTALGGIAVDGAGNAYITGNTYSTNFPTTANAFQQKLKGDRDIFVAKLDFLGSGLAYSTFLGGTDTDGARDLAIDIEGNAYVTGETYSTDFPVVQAFQSKLKGNTYNTFLTKVDSSGSSLVYSTYFGGVDGDYSTGTAAGGGFGVQVDVFGHVYLTGVTGATNFPIADPWQSRFGGGPHDGYVAKFAPSGKELIYSSYLGGRGEDWPWGIAIDSSGSAYVVGYSQSADFPTAGPLRSTRQGAADGFLTRIDVPPSLAPIDWGNGFRISIVGQPFQALIIEATEDLAHWRPVGTNTLSSPMIEFHDTRSAPAERRFYRTLNFLE